jgi:nucleotide-binding universal stress UspA family protein
MKKIKNITVAVDFSITARNAYRYARALAEALNASLTIVHIKENVLIVSDVMISPLPSEEHRMHLITDIKELVAEENMAAGSLIAEQEAEIRILTGDPVAVLTELSENKDADLIVIGTTGLSDVLTTIFGSTSLKVSNKAKCPVILVPVNAHWQPVEQILFASDYDSMTSELTRHIIDFALNIHAGIHFVNVRNYDPILEPRQKDIDWDKLFVAHDTDLSFEKHTIYGNDTVAELRKYSAEKNINLVAFVSKHRNFWQNLSHKSITENMTLSAATPIMVMHLDDEGKNA